MKNNRLVYLMSRYTSRQQTDAEMSELQALLADAQYEDVVKKFIDELPANGLPSYALREHAGDDILNTILQTPLPVRKTRVRPLYRWAAAAAIVCCCGTSLYFLLHPAKQQALAALQNHAGQPGINKAVLTLADGSQVTLDTAGHHNIQQGIQQQGNQLQYDQAANNHTTTNYNILTIPRGGAFQLVLPDGSKVWLNAASRLKYPTAFSGRERTVELQGEAYFEVAKDAAHPFTVKVNGQQEVLVLGTAFNIMAYTDEGHITTTLISGAVKVSNHNSQQVLQPGQQATQSNTTGGLSVEPADMNKALSWRTGFFEIEHTDLPTLMRQLSRWYDVDIVDQSNGKADYRFGGRISRTLKLPDVLRVLEHLGVHTRLEGTTIIILP